MKRRVIIIGAVIGFLVGVVSGPAYMISQARTQVETGNPDVWESNLDVRIYAFLILASVLLGITAGYVVGSIQSRGRDH